MASPRDFSIKYLNAAGGLVSTGWLIKATNQIDELALLVYYDFNDYLQQFNHPS